MHTYWNACTYTHTRLHTHIHVCVHSHITNANTFKIQIWCDWTFVMCIWSHTEIVCRLVCDHLLYGEMRRNGKVPAQKQSVTFGAGQTLVAYVNWPGHRCSWPTISWRRLLASMLCLTMLGSGGSWAMLYGDLFILFVCRLWRCLLFSVQ